MLGMDREDSNTSMCILELHDFKCFVILAVSHVVEMYLTPYLSCRSINVQIFLVEHNNMY